MGWLKDLVGNKTVAEIGNVVDNIITTDDERGKLKNELSRVVLGALTSLAEAQAGVLKAELTGSKLQRAWRPILMLAFGFIVVFYFFLYPVVKSFKPELPDLPELQPDFWDLLKLGVGGYVVGRSVEKTVDNFTKNVDLSHLRRRDRRAAMAKEDEEIGG